jgi:hypothetical protein
VQGTEVVTGETRIDLALEDFDVKYDLSELGLTYYSHPHFHIAMCSFTYFTFHNRPSSPENKNASNSLDKNVCP